jgi:anaerobic magnesium-protoporphyrin IX monomethyl ester cyclase
MPVLKKMKKKKKVLLVRPYFEMLKHELGVGFMPFEPLGLLSVQSVLILEGYEVELYDCLYEHPEKIKFDKETRLYRCGSDEEDILKKIREFKPDIVGVSGMFYAQKDSFNRIAELVKQVSKKIIVIGGGLYVSLIREKTLLENKCIDVAVIDEGEETIVELLKNLYDLSKVLGVCYRDRKGRTICNQPRPPKANLDEFPFPHRDFSKKFDYSKHVGYEWSDEFDLKKAVKRFIYYKIVFLPVIRNLVSAYFNYKHRDKPKALLMPHAFISTSRGCPSRCTFCSVHKFWHGSYRMRSAADVLEEIDMLVAHGIKEIAISDENFSLSKKRTIEICKGIIDKGYKIRITSNSGLYASSLDKEVLGYLYKAGLRFLPISVENGNQEFLNKTIKKFINLDQVKQVVKDAKEIGLNTRGYFIFGYPEETKDTMLDTLRYAFEAGFNKKRFYILQPFPGTEICQKAIDMGAIKNDLDISKLRFTTDLAQIETKDFTREDVRKIYNLANSLTNYEEVKDNLKNILGW